MPTKFLIAVLSLLFMASCGQHSEIGTENANHASPPTHETAAQANLTDTAPLRGTINGVQVSGFKASLKGSFLTLYTGDDPDFDFGTRLLMFTDLESPANQSVAFENTKQFGAWHIHINSKDQPSLNKILMSGYGMQLSTGAETDFAVPATLSLISDGEFPIRLEGRVEIKTSGLVSHNGVIDRGHDHMDTITYVAQDYVRSEFEGRDVLFHDPQAAMMENTNGAPVKQGFVQEAYYSAVFDVANGPRQVRKLQIAKREGEWRVENVLAEAQIHTAHPLNPPRRERAPYVFKTIAGQRFEQTVYARDGWQKLKEPGLVSCGGGQREGARGYCRVPFGVYQDASMEQVECSEVTYLFDEIDGKWSLTETVPPEQKFNSRTGAIEPRDGDFFGC